MDVQRSRKAFPTIQKYKELLTQQQEETTICPDYFLFPDQEVPQIRNSTEENDVKMDYMAEATGSPRHISNSMVVDIQNGGDGSSGLASEVKGCFNSGLRDLDSNNNIPDFTQLSTDIGFPKLSETDNNLESALTLTQVTSTHGVIEVNTPSQTTSVQSMTSPFLTSAALNPYRPISYSDSQKVDTFKSTNFVSEAAGSGCTVLTNPSKSDLVPETILNTQHFLYTSNDSLSSSCSSFSSEDLTPPSMSKSVDFLDLDKHQDNVTFYEDDIKPYTDTDDDLMNMLNIANDMTSSLHNDCHTLNISHDPLTWTPRDLNIWVSHICSSKGYRQAPRVEISGQVLSSLGEHQFAEIYGFELGDLIYKELQLLHAANNCMSQSFQPQPPMQQTDMKEFLQLPDFQGVSPQQPLPSLPVPVGRLSPTPSTSSEDTDTDTDLVKCPLPSVTSSSHKPGVGRRGHKQTIHLWQFLRELLLSKDSSTENCIRWVNKDAGIFKIEDSKRVAFLWGSRKNRPAMNYDKLSRSVRQYYKKGIIKKTEQSKRLVYQFCAGYL